MCTLVILRRPDDDWPILIAANRDEMTDRLASPPSRHWESRKNVVAGKDELASGTWLALNDDRLVAAVLNRQDSLGPAPNKRSRGELPLEACDHAEAIEATRAMANIEPTSYRSFNMVIADTLDAFWIKSDGRRILTAPIPEGLSMITSQDLNSIVQSSRIRFHLNRFRHAKSPNPQKENWDEWKALMGSRDREPGAGVRGAINLNEEHSFGTVSSSLIALPHTRCMGVSPHWLYCAGRPDEAPYEPVIL